MSLTKSERRQRIQFRIRKTVSGTAAQPRLSVYRSNKEIYAQIIDDVNGVTLVAASSRDKGVTAGTKIETANAVGKLSLKKHLKLVFLLSLLIEEETYTTDELNR